MIFQYTLSIIFYIFALLFLQVQLKKQYFSTSFNSYSEKIFYSIIIPVFNKFRYLNRSLSSILRQNFTNYEIVYGDDKSTDGSVDYIINISRTNQNVKYILHEKNYGTLNTGVDSIKAASGQYILSLDPDDEYECGLLSKLYSYLSKEHFDIVEFQNIHWVNRTRELFNNTDHIIYNRTTFFQRHFMWSLVLKCFYRDILIKGIANIPSELFELNFHAAEDLLIFSHSIVFCKKYLFINYGGYIYYEYQPGSSNRCSYSNCRRQRKLGSIACRYAWKYWASFNITVNRRCP